ncbi:hypothetical protein PGTUg99_004633 [Puccinia graminis f. sp. tritici]|uniref:Uncharacterized protein n=1 Tax=Puccinia graminis f. sp. tritici TaxID=56615 RepID=A0A5B0QKP3_PUCGR|nr:hypothetical protein PGTUg99_004633 [Puccinia graminis f. sp. tritici]
MRTSSPFVNSPQSHQLGDGVFLSSLAHPFFVPPTHPEAIAPEHGHVLCAPYGLCVRVSPSKNS